MMKFSDFEQYVDDGLFTKEKHPLADLYIFGYHSGPYSKPKNVWNDTTKMMRGLIVDSNGIIHARSFEKFFTFRTYLSEETALFSEGQILKLPNLPYKVYEKVDGTLTILYWIDDVPYLATQRSFSSVKAKRATEILHTKYSHLFEKLKRDRTYIFEAIYPESQVLIDYGNEEELILIGVIDTNTGSSLPLEEIGFKISKDWTSELKNISNMKELESLNIKNLEGFVIVYENDFRIKIKFPWYKEAHTLMNKLILLEHNIDLISDKLKELLSIKSNIATNFKIWERFKAGETTEQISKDFPNAYKYFGIEEWLENEYNTFVKNSQEISCHLNEEKLIRNSLVYKSSSENIMNNRMLNLKKRYD